MILRIVAGFFDAIARFNDLWERSFLHLYLLVSTSLAVICPREGGKVGLPDCRNTKRWKRGLKFVRMMFLNEHNIMSTCKHSLKWPETAP